MSQCVSVSFYVCRGSYSKSVNDLQHASDLIVAGTAATNAGGK
jgi:hypothetical protein